MDDFEEVSGDDGSPMRRVPDLSHWAYFFIDDFDRQAMDSWKSYGKCHGRDDLVEMFNPPVEDEEGNPDRTARILTGMAKKFCNGTEDGMKCSKRAECLNYAIEHKIYHGVWGGMTVRERRTIAGKRKR